MKVFLGFVFVFGSYGYALHTHAVDIERGILLGLGGFGLAVLAVEFALALRGL